MNNPNDTRFQSFLVLDFRAVCDIRVYCPMIEVLDSDFKSYKITEGKEIGFEEVKISQ